MAEDIIMFAFRSPIRYNHFSVKSDYSLCAICRKPCDLETVQSTFDGSPARSDCLTNKVLPAESPKGVPRKFLETKRRNERG